MEANQLNQKPLSQNHQPKTRRHEKAIFPHKLWKMVNDPRLDLAIKWTEDGQSFTLCDHFKDLCLGKENQFFYTRHLKSFVRQLHLYGFKKINKNQFAHENFKRDEPHLLSNIKRAYRTPTHSPPTNSCAKHTTAADEQYDEAYINYTYNNDSILNIYGDIYPNYSESNNIII